MKKFLTIVLSFFYSLVGQAEMAKVFPAPIVQLDPFFTHHVIIAEKSTHTLYLFKNEGGLPKMVKAYPMASGKKAGDKLFQGDYRTPEGVFEFTQFLTHKELVKRHGKQGEIYGVGAFVMNYPNPIDKRNKKTGSGIWLHSTNDETRIEKGLDSRGCLVAVNNDLIEISKYIELYKTQMIVVHELKWLNKKTWETRRSNIAAVIENWKQAWQEENLKNYISFYHPKEFHDSRHKSLAQFKTYKRAVFYNPGKPQIKFLNTSIMASDDYLLITLMQDYQSNTISDIGRKILYLKPDDYYNYKIVHESWNKDGLNSLDLSNDRIAFKPSLRFFKTTNPGQILHIVGKKEDN